MEKKNLCVAFSTQKGGAGKTTLAVLVASYLHDVKGYDVAIIDCDYPQHSIVYILLPTQRQGRTMYGRRNAISTQLPISSHV